MTWLDQDELHRTAKQLIDSGKAANPEEAVSILERFVLQVDVGPDVADSIAAQAALLTAVNAGSRAFLGGVAVRLHDDLQLTAGWGKGQPTSQALREWGGRVVRKLRPNHPTIVIGQSEGISSDVLIYARHQGWTGAAVQRADPLSAKDGMALSGVLAGALSVSEAFQHCIGDVEAGRRDVGVSLWDFDRDFRQAAPGPDLLHLPSAFWLLGLGHLGQGYAWSLGFLPFPADDSVRAHLMDTDVLVRGNLSTALLARPGDEGMLKTRLVATRLESLGIATRIIERRFDDTMRLAGDEPVLAFAGFDDSKPRRDLGGAQFGRVIDAGLGGTSSEYLDMLLHSFPSELEPASAFSAAATVTRQLAEPYRREIERRLDTGMEEGDASCGVVDIAGVSVGAAFAGAIAGVMGVADALRYLHGGPDYSVVALDLRSPGDLVAVPNTRPGPFVNLGYVNPAGVQ